MKNTETLHERIRIITFAWSIQKRRLEAYTLHIGKIFIDGDLHAETGVRINIWQAEKISWSNEEAAMEGMNTETTSTTKPHHRFKANLSRQITTK